MRCDVRQQVEAFEAEIPAAEARGVEMTAALEGKEAALEQMQGKLSGERETLRLKLEAAHGTLAPLEATVLDAQAAVDVATAEKLMLLETQV
jgi:hypothetical protein